MPFVTGSTPFGVFDTDTQFQADADRLVTFVTRKFGYPEMAVELSSSHIYASFEEACLEYSATVNQYQAKSVLTTLLGTATGSLSGQENRYPHLSVEYQRRLAEPYAEAAGLNGSQPLNRGSITLVAGQQRYDLQALINPTGSDGRARRMIIKEIFHLSPLAAYRFFGTTSTVNYLNNQFSFESFTPETIFYLLPIWEDVLRGMQFETSNRVRRSHYSYELNNNVLSLYPFPTEANTLFFTYYFANVDPYAPNSGTFDASVDGVANLSNVPFGNITYSKLNSLSKTWIWKMTFSLSKEILGQIRGKMSSIPIPDGDLTLNGPSLMSEAKQEQDQLRADLKGMLEETTYDKLAAKEAEIAENLNRALKSTPLLIYVG